MITATQAKLSSIIAQALIDHEALGVNATEDQLEAAYELSDAIAERFVTIGRVQWCNGERVLTIPMPL